MPKSEKKARSASAAAEWARGQVRNVRRGCVVSDTPGCADAVQDIVAEVAAGRAKRGAVTAQGIFRFIRDSHGFKGSECSLRSYLAKHTGWYSHAA